MANKFLERESALTEQEVAKNVAKAKAKATTKAKATAKKLDTDELGNIVVKEEDHGLNDAVLDTAVTAELEKGAYMAIVDHWIVSREDNGKGAIKGLNIWLDVDGYEIYCYQSIKSITEYQGKNVMAYYKKKGLTVRQLINEMEQKSFPIEYDPELDFPVKFLRKPQ